MQIKIGEGRYTYWDDELGELLGPDGDRLRAYVRTMMEMSNPCDIADALQRAQILNMRPLPRRNAMTAATTSAVFRSASAIAVGNTTFFNFDPATWTPGGPPPPPPDLGDFDSDDGPDPDILYR